MMLESFLVEGRQDLEQGKELVFGQSITDACMGWERTELVLARAGSCSARATRGNREVAALLSADQRLGVLHDALDLVADLAAGARLLPPRSAAPARAACSTRAQDPSRHRT